MADFFADEEPIFVDVTEGSGIFYVAGEKLAPSCALVDFDSQNSLSGFLECIASAMPTPIGVKLSDVSMHSDRYLITPHNGGRLQSLRIQTTLHGLPVLGSTLKLTLNPAGQVTQLMGDLVDPQSYQSTAKPLPDAELNALVAGRLGDDVTLLDRYFDVIRGSFVGRFYKNVEESRVFSFDETTQRLFDVSILEYGGHSLVDKTVIKSNYTNELRRQTSKSDGTVAFSARSEGPDCQIFLDHGASHATGQPLITTFDPANSRYSDVISGIALCDANERISIAPPDDDFLNVYYWMHDLAVFANSELGAYSSFTDWSNAKPLRVAVVRAGQTQCGYGGCAVPGKKRNSIQLARANGQTENLHTMAHEYGHILHLMHGYAASNDLGLATAEGFADHNAARYNLYRFLHNDSRPFDTVNAISFGDSPTVTRIPATNYGFTVQPNSVYSLLQGRPCSNAGLNPYLCGQVLVDIYRELAWNECQLEYKNSLGQTCRVGQAIIELRDTSSSPIIGITDTAVSSSASVSNEFPPQGESLAGPTVVPTDPPPTQSVLLANEAYTYAISEMEGPWGIEEFTLLVNYYYFQLAWNGTISTADFGRVMTVINSHCLGYGHGCTTERILPGTELPALRSKRLSFDDGCTASSCQSLTLAQEASASSSTQLTAHATLPAGSPHAMRFVTLDSPLDYLEFSLNIPRRGQYRFKASARALQPGTMLIDFVSPDSGDDPLTGSETPMGTDFNEVAVWHVQPASTSTFDWSPGPAIELAAGLQLIRVRTTFSLDIEALHVGPIVDRDEDGWADPEDNCPLKPNPNQANLDGDRLGDACDPDIDGDFAECRRPIGTGGVRCNEDLSDNCPFVPNPRPTPSAPQADADGDGLGDACDPDADGNGVLDVDIVIPELIVAPAF